MKIIQFICKGIEIGLGLFSLFALAVGSINVAGVCVILMVQIIFWREREEYVRCELHDLRVFLRKLAIKTTRKIVMYYNTHFC